MRTQWCTTTALTTRACSSLRHRAVRHPAIPLTYRRHEVLPAWYACDMGAPRKADRSERPLQGNLVCASHHPTGCPHCMTAGAAWCVDPTTTQWEYRE